MRLLLIEKIKEKKRNKEEDKVRIEEEEELGALY